MVPFLLVCGTSYCSEYLIYYNNCSRITYISDTRACCVCRNITIRATFFMNGPFHPSGCASFYIIIAFVLYHQCTTPYILLMFHGPSDCGAFIIQKSLLFIDTLYFWYLNFCILYVCIDIISNICTILSMLGTLTASACT